MMTPTFCLQSRQPVSAHRRKLGALCSAAALFALFGLNLASAQEKAASATPVKTGDEPLVLETVVVKGVRASLISAQEIKQESLQTVDSIVAVDIGKFPDNTVADALQRIPGIQVARDNGEVNSVVVRGLPNLATTLNGHEIFTGTGRGVALQDIPAELVAGIDVYKTNAPDQLEGGIAGLIDIRLRKPFDFGGLKVAGGGRGIFGKYADGTSWIGSALVSNRWKLSGGGEFGALFSVSDSMYHFKDQRVFNFLWEDVTTNVVPGLSSIKLPVTAGSLLVPGDRKRKGYNVSLQWRPNSQLELYSDVLFTGYRNKHDVHFFIGFPRFGAFQTVEVNSGTNIVSKETTKDNFHLNSTQAFDDKTDSYQAVFGAKWRRDGLLLTTEGVYNWSSVKNRGVIVDVQYVQPSTFTFDLNSPSGTNVGISGNGIRDGNNFRFWGIFDNRGYQTSEQTAWKADAEYIVKAGALTKIKTGVRVSSRDARSRQSSVNDVAPVAGRGVTPTTSLPGFGSLAPDGLFSSSEFAASNWYAGNPDFQRDHAASLRPIFGLSGEPGFNPTLSFTDKEKTYAAYAQANYRIENGSMPMEGLFGVRVIRTDEDLIGNLATGAPVNNSASQTDVLPVLNGRVKLDEHLFFRLSAGRTITRPNFGDLNPVVSLFGPTTTGGSVGTGSGGNPNLKSVKSDNYDISLEHYFAKTSFMSLTGFYRRIDGFVQSFSDTEVIGGKSYIVTRPRNTGRSSLKGVEVAYRQFFDFLPTPLKGFGMDTNFTYISGTTDDRANNTTRDLALVSKYSYNIVGIYEKGPFSARLAYNWRGGYVDTYTGPGAAPASGQDDLRIIRVKATSRLDFSASYALGEHFTITLDATNLLNQKFQDYFGSNAHLTPRDSRLFDRTIELGMRFQY